MHPIQDLFLEGFSYVLQIDMHFICTPMWTKFYSCKKWVLHRQSHKWRDSGSEDSYEFGSSNNRNPRH
jgi:hypothetical protein